jgi:tetratricopeptide (TPR) repeat protein
MSPEVATRDDEDGADGEFKVLESLIGTLERPLLETLEFFCLPHWVDRGVLDQVRSEPLCDDKSLQVLAERGLIEVWGDGAQAVRGIIRRPMLTRMARDDRAKYTRLSAIFANAFAAMADGDGDVFHHIESVFHRLACDPDAGTQQLLADGITWKSEPFHAFEALSRLIAAAREQKERGFLSPWGDSILTLLTLYSPDSAPTARDEEIILDGLRLRAHPDELFVAELSLRLGLNHIVRGRTAAAHEPLCKALQYFGAQNLRRGEGDALRAIGRTALREDKLESAKEYFTQARDLFVSLGLVNSAAYCIKALGETDFYLGRYASAELQFRKALNTFDANDVGLAAANTRVVYSQLLSAKGQFSAAQEQISRAQKVYSEIGNDLGVGNCLKNSAVALFEAGDYTSAQKQLTEAYSAYQKWGSSSGAAACMLWSAACTTRVRPDQSALALLARADELYRDSGDRFGQASVHREQGIALVALEKPTEGISKLIDAEREFNTVGNAVEALSTAVARGLATLAHGMIEPQARHEVTETAKHAYRLFNDIGHRRYRQDSVELLARITLFGDP